MDLSRRAWIAALLVFAACAGPRPEPVHAEPHRSDVEAAPPAPFTAMTFNVRYGTADDGPDAWPLRRERLLARVREVRPEILGVQEALDFQVEELERELPEHVRVGQGRDGGARGEHAALFVDRRRFEVLEHGDFWLSETPDVVASVGWDAALTRMCTWAELRERSSGRALTVWNTHFDHRGAVARERSAALIAARVAERGAERSGPRIVMGDLNTGERSAPLATLAAAGLVDTFRVLHPEAREVGTFHAFRGGTQGEKIDYVLVDDGLVPLAAEILSAPAADGRFPSDHHAVTARLVFRAR